jgi:rubrerythrin
MQPAELALAELKGSGTLRNLLEFFAREAQILVRYRRFASTAKHEGFGAVADLFERLAQNQNVFIEGHLDYLRSVSDPLSELPLGRTVDNLSAALATEEEAVVLYPSAWHTAGAEGFVDIASWFQTLAESKREQRDRLAQALREHFESGESEEVNPSADEPSGDQ